MTLTVLVMSAGSIPAVAVIDALKQQVEVPVRLIAADMDELSAGFLLSDAHYLVPAADAADFIPTVRKICQQECVDVVFPIIDEELQVFADNAPLLNGIGARVITNSPETVRVAKDKVLTAKRCAELGVLMPPTLLSEELQGASLLFPLIIKPRDGRGSINVHMVKDRSELDFFVDRVPNPIIQQFIQGHEYTIDVLTDFEGRLLSLVPKQRMMVKSGMQTKGRTVKDAELFDFATHVAMGFRLFPRGNIQCIRDDSERIWLVEVNPKFSASLPLTVAAGVNMPLLLLRMVLGDRLCPLIGNFDDGLIMLRVWKELFTH